MAISRIRCKIGGKLVLITNRKSYMSLRLVPKSVTLNDLEPRNGPYFVLFHRIRVRCRRKKFTFAISFPDEFLVSTHRMPWDSTGDQHGPSTRVSKMTPVLTGRVDRL